MKNGKEKTITRRSFLATGAAAATAISGFPFVRSAQAQTARPLKIGVIGTGGRGTGAASNALVADPGVQLVAMADIVPDQIEQSLKALKEDRDLQGELQKNIKVEKDHIFTGPHSYEKLLQTDIDYVILTTPPAFRPLQFEAAVQAGKHVFAEKPVATDPVGVRKILQSAQKAKDKGLSVVVGLNARHDKSVMETVQRIHDGALGETLSGNIYRLGGGLWHRGADPSWSEMEYQCRNWYYFCWLSGDQIVEMVVHQIDLMNWALGAYPVSALGSGGRQVRTEPKYGNIWDNMTIDYEYPNGVHVLLMCRQWPNCDNKNANVVIGTKGKSDSRGRILGENKWKYEGERTNSSVYEHSELIDSIRKGKARNDMLDFAAHSTLSAIMGRESAYTGQVVTWDDMLSSDLDLFPKSIELGPAPKRAVPIPGQPRPL
ncbi:MAG: Gfo/Idh/MocA family oxidoreductase [Candidatus Glassbacteria bacterium]|nr:Gfo/Idh/MocA family oxidoreductase [Candidatus Glassbacteria bacterium]